jgi:hypothetical protein
MMNNDLSHHLARSIVDDRVREARRQQRAAAARRPAGAAADRSRQARPFLVSARVLLSRLR